MICLVICFELWWAKQLLMVLQKPQFRFEVVLFRIYVQHVITTGGRNLNYVGMYRSRFFFLVCMNLCVVDKVRPKRQKKVDPNQSFWNCFAAPTSPLTTPVSARPDAISSNLAVSSGALSSGVKCHHLQRPPWYLQ